ncbi:MAG TPA: DCC1-like thiol-disulfide oxidoreductase family protein [Acidobacteriota bacterium]
MRSLTVLYDSDCELCRRIRAWLEGQPAYVNLLFVPAGSDEARRRFPELDHAATLAELTIIGDNGAVYRNGKAFLICLWALRDYREWSLALASPELWPIARRFLVWMSNRRFQIGEITPVHSTGQD